MINATWESMAATQVELGAAKVSERLARPLQSNDSVMEKTLEAVNFGQPPLLVVRVEHPAATGRMGALSKAESQQQVFLVRGLQGG